MQNYLKLLKFLKGHKKIFGLAILFMAIYSIFEGLQLSLMAPFVDILFTQRKIILPDTAPGFLVALADKINTIEPKQFLAFFPIPVLIMYIIKNGVAFMHGYLMNDVSQRVMRDIRDQLYAKIQNLSLDYFSRKRVGELMSRITNDVNIVENAVSYGITDLFRQTFILLILFTSVFIIHAKAALLIFLVFPFVGWPIAMIGKRLKKLSRNQQEKMADISSLLLETISGVRVVKAFGTEQYEINRFRDQNHGFYKLKMKSIKRTLAISPLTEIAGLTLGVLMIVWFGHQILTGELSFGVFAWFFGSIMSMISPFKKLGNVNAITQQALAANKRIHEVLDTAITVQEKANAKAIGPIKDKISMEHVDFQYDEESGIVLQDINLEINRGELVAIVGPTGTGKSTLVNLIPRFYDPTKGVVKIDGVDLRDVTFKSLRLQTGIVAQETFLFNETVKSNIAYGNRDASMDQIVAAAKQAFAHRFIEKMPQGYDTVIGDRGFRLSGGEKQRVTIARAILKNPPILILDEATSQLDSESEKFVQEALDKLMQGRTVIAIAHRLSTIMKASKIVVLDQGKVVGIDTHSELLKTCPLYKRLYETQFQT